jgi:hypothetical protein
VRVADEAEGNSSEDPEVAAIQTAARVLMEVASMQDPATRPSAQRIHEVPRPPARVPDQHAAVFSVYSFHLHSMRLSVNPFVNSFLLHIWQFIQAF